MAGGQQHLKKAINNNNDDNSNNNNNNNDNSITIEAGKKNLSQSEWKLNFLVKLIRGAWVPGNDNNIIIMYYYDYVCIIIIIMYVLLLIDALAQLKFSPKHKAVDVSNIVKRATSIAKTFHDVIPEELYVKEVIVTKGQCQKRMRIMGRGRTGFGYKRRSHVLVKVSKIDFDKEINNSKTFNQKKKWLKRLEIVKTLKSKKVDELNIKMENNTNTK